MVRGLAVFLGSNIPYREKKSREKFWSGKNLVTLPKILSPPGSNLPGKNLVGENFSH